MVMSKKLIASYLFLLFFSSTVFSQVIDNSISDSILSITLQKQGREAGRLGDYEAALENFNQLYFLTQKKYGVNNYRLATPLVNMGIQYKNLQSLDKALEVYQKAEKLIIDKFGENYSNLGIIYTNLGNIYRQNGDYNKALEYQLNAHRILRKDSVRLNSNLQITKFNIAELQLKLGFAEDAIRFALRNLSTISPELKPNLYDLIGSAYKIRKEYNLSEKYYLLAIKSWIDLYGKDNVELITEYLAYSSFLLSQKEFEKAYLYAQKANEIVLKFYREKSINYADVQSSFGDYFYMKNSEARQMDEFRIQRKKDLKEAIQYYQNSIVALSDSFDNKSPFLNPSLKNIISEIQLVDELKKKAIAMEKLADIYASEFDNENSYKYYNGGLSALTCAVDLIHRLQIGFENEDSKYFLAQNQQSTFYDAIKISYKLYKQTRNVEYIDKAFEFSERSKSSNLLASVKEMKAKEFGGIPDNLLTRENDLKSYIATYTSLLVSEIHSEKPDSPKVNLFNSKIFKYNEEYNKLIDSFEKDYPNYYAFKYESKVVGINEIRSQLNGRQALVEFYTVEPDDNSDVGELYRFVITKDSVNLSMEKINKSYVENIQTVFNFLTNPNYLFTRKKDYVDYSVASFRLYEKLLKPVVSKINGKDITIIPHDKLSYIPFDALLTEMPDTSEMNFRNLNYLIRNYTINYSYSATLLYDFFEPLYSNSKKILAFAPEYNASFARTDPESLTKHFFSPLSAAANEVKLISEHIKAETFVGSFAQEASFKQKASKFSILHLAMHTIINDSLPMYSKLVFSNPDKNSNDDGFLNTFEIYNMKLNARLAVLSACETGTGKLQKGEGVMSMARGFIYAGCPSIVMTLWQVEDKAGSKIMSDFYNYLSKGKRKDIALRMAKLNHLKSSDPLTAHPHYWLGYVSIGDPEPLFSGKDFYFVLVIIIVVALFVADWYIRKNKRAKKIY